MIARVSHSSPYLLCEKPIYRTNALFRRNRELQPKPTIREIIKPDFQDVQSRPKCSSGSSSRFRGCSHALFKTTRTRGYEHCRSLSIRFVSGRKWKVWRERGGLFACRDLSTSPLDTNTSNGSLFLVHMGLVCADFEVRIYLNTSLILTQNRIVLYPMN